MTNTSNEIIIHSTQCDILISINNNKKIIKGLVGYIGLARESILFLNKVWSNLFHFNFIQQLFINLMELIMQFGAIFN